MISLPFCCLLLFDLAFDIMTIGCIEFMVHMSGFPHLIEVKPYLIGMLIFVVLNECVAVLRWYVTDSQVFSQLFVWLNYLYNFVNVCIGIRVLFFAFRRMEGEKQRWINIAVSITFIIFQVYAAYQTMEMSWYGEDVRKYLLLDSFIIIYAVCCELFFWLLFRKDFLKKDYQKAKVFTEPEAAGNVFDWRAFAEQYHPTIREVEIAQLVSTGLSNEVIGQQCFISESTVKRHLTSIYQKTNIKNRVALIAYTLSGKHPAQDENRKTDESAVNQ